MKPSKQAKVIVATDRKGVPAAVRAMLTLEFDLVRVVYDADTLLREALRLRPDLVVIEAELSLRDEFRATRENVRRHIAFGFRYKAGTFGRVTMAFDDFGLRVERGEHGEDREGHDPPFC